MRFVFAVVAVIIAFAALIGMLALDIQEENIDRARCRAAGGMYVRGPVCLRADLAVPDSLWRSVRR